METIYETITKNTGNILLKEGTKINEINRNIGNIKLMDNGSVYLIERNVGNITLGDRSSVGVISFNSGCIDVESNTNICEIKGNRGTITIKDHCTISGIESNEGLIKLGDNCVVKSIIGSGVNIKCGLGCIVPEAEIQGNGPQRSHVNYNLSNFKSFLSTQPGYRVPPNHRYSYSQSSYSSSVNSNKTGMMATTQIPSKSIQQPSDTARHTKVAPSNKSTPQLDESISEDLLCAICMANKKDVAFNCGHTWCGSCADDLKHCPNCRKEILQKMKIFL